MTYIVKKEIPTVDTYIRIRLSAGLSRKTEAEFNAGKIEIIDWETAKKGTTQAV